MCFFPQFFFCFFQNSVNIHNSEVFNWLLVGIKHLKSSQSFCLNFYKFWSIPKHEAFYYSTLINELIFIIRQALQVKYLNHMLYNKD